MESWKAAPVPVRRIVAVSFGLDLALTALASYAYLLLLGLERSDEIGLALSLVAAPWAVKAGLLVGVLPWMLRAVTRFNRLSEAEGVGDELVEAAAQAVYRTPLRFAALFAAAWGIGYPSVTAALLHAFPERVPLSPQALLGTALFGVATFTAALALSYTLLRALLAPAAARISLAARERGLAVARGGLSLALRIAVLAVCLGVAPTSWIASLSFMSDVRSNLRAVQDRGRFLASDLARAIDQRSGRWSPSHEARLRTREPGVEAAFVASRDGRILRGRGARERLARFASLRRSFAEALGRKASGAADDPRSARAVAYERLDDRRVAGVIIRAAGATTPGLAFALALFATIALLWFLLFGGFWGSAVAAPLRAVAAVVENIEAQEDARRAGRVPVHYPDEAGRLADGVYRMVDRLAESAARVERQEQERERARREALESEEKFRALVHAAFEGVGLHEKGKILLVNEALARMFGYEAGELEGRSALDLAAPESRDLVRENIRTGHDQPYEIICLRKDGSTFVGEVRARSLSYRGREVRVASVRDITDAKQAEAERVRLLREVGDRHRVLEAVRDAIPDLMFRVDAEGRVLDFSGPREELHVSPERIPGARLDALLPAGVAQEALACLHRTLQTRSLETFEYQLAVPAGIRNYEARFVVCGDGQVLMIVRNVTRRKRLEAERERLLESHRVLSDAERKRAAELGAIVENLAEAVLVCDAQGRMTRANGSALRLLGLAAADVGSLDAADLAERVHLRDADGRSLPAARVPLLRALRGEVVRQELAMARNLEAGREFYLRVSAAPIRDAAGAIVGAVAVASDVTEILRFDQLKDEFIGVAAHELKTPVAIVKGYSQALRRMAAAESPGCLEMLDAIDRGADRIHRLVEDLLLISQLHLGRLTMPFERVDLGELVARIVARKAEAAPRHRVRLLRTDSVSVLGDPVRLTQALGALLDNAVKYSPGGGSVDVELAAHEAEAVISVRDRGVGIPRDRQARIFERFYRAHTDTEHDYGGMGVGLYLCRELVTRHGGRVWFESAEGQGSTFFIGLPLRAQEVLHADG